MKGLKAGSVSLNASGASSGSYRADVYIEDPTLKIDGIKAAGKNKYTLEMNLEKNLPVVFGSMHQDVLFISNKPEIVHDTGHGLLVSGKEGEAKLKTKINGKNITIKVKVNK